ncbi:MAG: formate/nitrite transporter family protein [Flavobacteriales bacterium]|nr:formate/nitrite transporter family protein [Flavobacteriales bacterium]
MAALFGSDAFTPAQITERIERVGVVKARLPLLSLVLLGVLAGAFIGLGAMYATLVTADTDLSHAVGRVLGGVVFSLGLLLVVIAGAELFTGNNLLAMAWADGRITTREVLRNWVVVCLANFLGAAGIALLVHLSGHTGMNGGAVADQYVRIAAAKCTLPFWRAFFSGVLCNILVCLAVWMAFAGRSVMDKAVAIVFPISAFVAAGFEHSVANMYFIPIGMLCVSAGSTITAGVDITWVGMLGNLAPVILGNLLGGSGFVAFIYYIIYRRDPRISP